MKIFSFVFSLFLVVLFCSYSAGRECQVESISFLQPDTTPVHKPQAKRLKSKTRGKQPLITLDTVAVAAGLELVANLDCATCHSIEEQRIGPSYKAIARKYALTQANIDLLAKRTIDGGSGIWSSVPMTSHQDLSMADAQKMMQFIFSLK